MLELKLKPKHLAVLSNLDAGAGFTEAEYDTVLVFLRKKFRTRKRVYAYDVSIELDMDYEKVRLILNRLEKERKISEAKV